MEPSKQPVKCEYKSCCYFFCCVKGGNGGIKAIAEDEARISIMWTAFNCSILRMLNSDMSLVEKKESFEDKMKANEELQALSIQQLKGDMKISFHEFSYKLVLKLTGFSRKLGELVELREKIRKLAIEGNTQGLLELVHKEQKLNKCFEL